MTRMSKQHVIETLSWEIQQLDFPLPPVEDGQPPHEDTYCFWYDRIQKLQALQNILAGAEVLKLLPYDEVYVFEKLFKMMMREYKAEQERVRALK